MMSFREDLRIFAGGDELLLTPYLGLLIRTLDERGLPGSRLLQGTGLSVEDLLQPGMQLPASLCLRWIDGAREMGMTPEMSLEVAAGLDLRYHGFLGYAVLASSTLGEALAMAVRYLTTRTRVLLLSHFQDGDRQVIQFDQGVPLGERFPWIMDGMMAALFAICRQMFRVAPPAVTEFRLGYPEQPHHQRLRAETEGRLVFDCGVTQLRFPAALLAIPVSTADAPLASLAAQQCEQALKAMQAQQSLLGQVRQLAEQQPGRQDDMERVAEALHMTSRTLRRRLQALGTGYQQIVDELRRAQAMDALANSAVRVEVLAERLGYSDASNFGRAFRRWTGMSPAAWRRQRRHEVP